VLALAAVAGVAATALSGCRASQADPAHTPYVKLDGGTYHGAAWGLWAWEQGSELCMMLVPAGVDPGRPVDRSSPTGPAAGGGGCGFDDKDPSGGFYTSSTGPDHSGWTFGPLPAAATGIRVATHEVLATKPLPAGKGLPAGRYWLHFEPAGWPGRAQGTALDTPQPLDAHGRKVAFAAF
jgi:hypothetical protein